MTTARPRTSCCPPTITALGGWVRASTNCTHGQAGERAGGGPREPPDCDTGPGQRDGTRLSQVLRPSPVRLVPHPSQLEAHERYGRDGPGRDHQPRGGRHGGRAGVGHDDGGRDRADADRARQLRGQPAAAAAHVEPQLDADEGNRQGERDPERTRRRPGGDHEESHDDGELGDRDARGKVGSGQGPMPPTVDQHHLGRRPGEECHHGGRTDAETGEAGRDQQAEQHRFEGEPPPTMFGGQGHRPPRRTRGRPLSSIGCLASWPRPPGGSGPGSEEPGISSSHY